MHDSISGCLGPEKKKGLWRGFCMNTLSIVNSVSAGMKTSVTKFLLLYLTKILQESCSWQRIWCQSCINHWDSREVWRGGFSSQHTRQWKLYKKAFTVKITANMLRKRWGMESNVENAAKCNIARPICSMCHKAGDCIRAREQWVKLQIKQASSSHNYWAVIITEKSKWVIGATVCQAAGGLHTSVDTYCSLESTGAC